MADTTQPLLRTWGPPDRPALISLMTDPQVREYLGGPIPLDTAEQRITDRLADVPWCYFVIIDNDDTVVGTLTFDRKTGPWEVSFQLAPRAWGRGLMTQALIEAIDQFRVRHPGEVLIAVTQQANRRARNTLERVGGILDGAFEYKGELQVRYVIAEQSLQTGQEAT